MKRKESASAERAVSQRAVKELALDLLADCFEDELAHLHLRIIRDAQQPRFAALRKAHPAIYRDFMEARKGPHEILHANRQRRVQILTAIIEGYVPGESPKGSLPV